MYCIFILLTESTYECPDCDEALEEIERIDHPSAVEDGKKNKITIQMVEVSISLIAQNKLWALWAREPFHILLLLI